MKRPWTALIRCRWATVRPAGAFERRGPRFVVTSPAYIPLERRCRAMGEGDYERLVDYVRVLPAGEKVVFSDDGAMPAAYVENLADGPA